MTRAMLLWVVGPFEVLRIPLLGLFSVPLLGLPLSLFWCIGLTNAYNFLDGIDGIAATQGLVGGLACVIHPPPARADGEDLSTTDLLRRTAAALGVPVRLVPVPTIVLEACAAVLGTRALVQRLCGSLQVDIGKARRVLGWRPPVGVDEGLRRAVQSLGAKST